MKKPLALAFVGALGLYGLTMWFSRGASWPLTVEAQEATVVAAFGDSLTQGQGAEKNEAYPVWLETMSGAKVLNFGRNGDTTGTAIPRLDQVLEAKPQIVLMTLGGNDILSRTPLNETLENLRQIFQRIHDANVMPIYIGIEPPGVGDNWSMAIQQVCKEAGVLYIPGAMNGLWKDSNLMADPIHPNGKGYKIIAERIFEVIKPYLRCDGPAC